MVSWYSDEIRLLIVQNLPFKICFGILLVLFTIIYAFSIKKHGIMSMTVRPYQNLSNTTSAVIMMLTFVSIGPWVIAPQFYILFLFQVLQLFVHGFVSFIIISHTNGVTRIMCFPVHFAPNGCSRFAIRAITAAAHIIIAMWLHYSLDLACWLIEKDVYLEKKKNSDFINCIDTVFGANILQTGFHGIAAVQELICGVVAAFWRQSSFMQSRQTKYEDTDGQVKECSYECSSEVI